MFRALSNYELICGNVLSETLDKDALDVDEKLTDEEWSDFVRKYKDAFALSVYETAEMMLDWYLDREDDA